MKDLGQQSRRSFFTLYRSALSSAGKYYLLAALINSILICASEIPVVHLSVLRLVWRWSRWGTFPFYGDLDLNEYVSQTYPPEIGLLVAIFTSMVLGQGVVVAIMHGLSFAAAVLRCRWLGRPRYWKDVRPRVRLRLAWAISARRSWWAWPTAQLIWLLFIQLGLGLQYAFYPLIDTGFTFLVGNVLAICLIYTAVSTRVVLAAVIAAVDPEDLRCGRCGYLLRGLEVKRCPECGHDGQIEGTAEYSLRWRDSNRMRKVRVSVTVAVVAGLLLAPVMLPATLASVPRNWLRFVPAAIQPDWQVLNPNKNAFPIRLDTTCVINHEDSLAVIWFDLQDAYTARYLAAFWIDAAVARDGRSPDASCSGVTSNPSGPPIIIGPWRLGCSVAGETMFWLGVPDATYHVRAFEPQRPPADLLWIGELSHGRVDAPEQKAD